MTLSDVLSRSLLNRAQTAEGFDPHAHLRRVLADVGLSPEHSGGGIEFIGRDPVIPSVFRLGGAAAIGLVAKSVAVAALWHRRGGKGQSISVDLRKTPHRLSPFYDRKWELLNGYPPRNNSDPGSPFSLRFYPTRDDRWVMPLNIYPQLKKDVQRLLACPDDSAAVARAIRRWDARELEEAGAGAGVVMPMLRSLEELMGEPQYMDVLSQLPVIEIEKIAESPPEPFPAGASAPLGGIRALGLGHVIAGAGTGRALALHGADVLNVWEPTAHEIEPVYASANVGVRSTLLDMADARGLEEFLRLLRGADVLYANRRFGFLDSHGLSPQEAAHVRPGIVHATVSLHGQAGGWASRPGFDQSAGCVSGVMSLEGTPDAPLLPAIMVVNDYLAAWMLTTGIIAALMRRAREGGSYRVHVSLTRLSLWLYSLGIFDKRFACGQAGRGREHTYLSPEVFMADTACGSYQGVTDQVVMSGTPGEYRTVLVPRGSSRPVWLDA